MDVGNKKTVFHDDMIAKDRIKELVGKFPSYPCIAERHPQKIEDFIATYNAVLTEVKAAVS
jgi:hypothetical protein